MRGRAGAWARRCVGAWVRGRVGAWVRGCVGAWVRGRVGAWVRLPVVLLVLQTTCTSGAIPVYLHAYTRMGNFGGLQTIVQGPQS